MLVILAGDQDSVAPDLARRWAAQDARLLRPSDLSRAGWHHHLPSASSGKAVVAGEVVESATIRGVLTRLPAITAADLPHIRVADRAYVAAEMTAFLLAWLSSLPCPVLNRPAPGCLAGPGWWPEQWLALAAGLGLAVRPMGRLARLGQEAPAMVTEAGWATVTVVGQHCFGSVAPRLAEQARRLASAARVDLLTLHFDGAESGAALLGADAWPDLTSPEVAEAIVARLTEGGRR